MGREGRTGELVEARASVERFCELLITPSPAVLDQAALLLESAIADLALWRKGGAVPAEKDLTELRRIRRAAAQARGLLQRAAAYHAGWAAYLGSRTGGYQAGGEAAPVARPRRLLAEG
jgi:hypothetical protein